VVAPAAHDRLKERIPAPALRFASTRARHYMPAMIRIAITPAAFDAIAATLPVGSVAFEPDTGDKGERHIWLVPEIVNKLRHLCGPGESYSDVILKVAAGERRS
jgi:hypothetical protein